AVGLRRIFVPSSIAAFGPEVPRDRTPDETVLRPRSVYGITKVAGELLVDYYGRRYDLDCRGVRYPGLISHATAPGGGTTDYAVAIYFEAVQSGRYECFVREDTCLPMMYMPDAIKATLQIMAAPRERLTRRGDYNLGAMSFTVGEQAASIRELVPDFTVSYVPDYRQAIAESWPRSVDDRAARADWDWTPDFDLDAMTRDMIAALR
ncbi:MAG: NAD-dependent epimerase/dehydratase family protein, partial [Flavobacteriales bacterium]|nr:NAD-dependent epimerase/dehydratase family protein [Flavobacteriales bacterium]